jgi:hypothetical protein
LQVAQPLQAHTWGLVRLVKPRMFNLLPQIAQPSFKTNSINKLALIKPLSDKVGLRLKTD